MATTGELRAIIEELQLIDAGDAASFLGEEESATDETLVLNQQQEGLSASQTGIDNDYTSCEELSSK